MNEPKDLKPVFPLEVIPAGRPGRKPTALGIKAKAVALEWLAQPKFRAFCRDRGCSSHLVTYWMGLEAKKRLEAKRAARVAKQEGLCSP